MKRKHGKKPEEQRKIASERIKVLFSEAKSRFKEDPKLSNRYVNLARKISMKYKVKIPRGLKRSFCKHCYCFLLPPVNCRVRAKDGKMIYLCLNCKKITRFGYK